MCAINGFNYSDEKLIHRMNKETAHRGPDDTGIFSAEQVTLGHNRLSIIDISDAGHQPMKSNDGRFTIVYNGELYNFRELKKELAADYEFKTKSDTEVILAAYIVWGRKCLSRFNGMFAFAIWDRKEEMLFLARDSSGIKPLYYYWDGEKFIFSSEIKAILEAGISRKLCQEAFKHYFHLLYVPEPFTMYEHILKVPVGSFLTFQGRKLIVEPYVAEKEATIHPSTYGKNELVQRVHDTVSDAVLRQLVSDKPLGVYLSGGIDSSIVLACMAKEHTKIDTFSVGFELREDEQKEKFNADFNLARKTANFFGTNHHEVLLQPGDVIDIFEKAVWHLDEPISNATILAQIKLAEFAKKHVDVVLSGDGGDELFGGYERYKMSLAADYFQKLPSIMRKPFLGIDRINKLNTSTGIERFKLFLFQKDSVLKKVLHPSHIDETTSNFIAKRFFDVEHQKDFAQLFLDVDRQTWLADESLMRADKMSMAYGLENRVPFLDSEVVALAQAIPMQYKVSLSQTKMILREAFKTDLPEYLFNQPKRGWFSPAAKWLRHEDVYAYVREVLSPGYYVETKQLFEWEDISSMLDGHVQKSQYNLNILWALITFQIWARTYNVKL